jgi:hypothetical protein
VPGAVNAIAWAEERVGILNPEAPIRVPYIPSPDWSRGLITDEAGQPRTWGDTHGWSKFTGATGVELLVGSWAAKAAKARQLTSAATNYVERNGFRFSEYYYRKLWETGWKAPSLVAREILEATGGKGIPVPGKPGFFRYENGGWEMIYNPATREVWHLMPIN